MSRSVRIIIASTIVAGVLLVSAPVDARPRPTGPRVKFEANKSFGLGIMFGVPTGLSGKYYLGKSTAIDFGVGVSHGISHGNEATQFHMDFLWHPVVLAKAEPFWVPLYVGIGARFLADNNRFGDGAHMGVRGVGGIMLDFERTPIDIFLEFAFVFDAIVHSNHSRADFNGALGIRYYF